MFNENEIRITGNLTAVPNLVSTEGKKTVAKAILMHNRRYKVEGEKKPREERVALPIELWDNGKGRAERFAQMVTSKTPILIKGSLKMDEWKDSNTGASRSKLKINVTRWDFLLPKEEEEPAGKGETAKTGPARAAKPAKTAAAKG